MLEDAYVGIRMAERRLELDRLEPEEAIDRLVELTWAYHLKHPEFLTLVNSENLHQARHLKTSNLIRSCTGHSCRWCSRSSTAGWRRGFPPRCRSRQLNITIASISYYYLTNRFTGSIVFDRDFMSKENLAARKKFNIDTILRLVMRAA